MLNYVLTVNFIFNMNLDQNFWQRMNAVVGKYLHISLCNVLHYLIFTCADPGLPIYGFILGRAHMFTDPVDESLWGTFVRIIFLILPF
jgi:hypothetical protein